MFTSSGSTGGGGCGGACGGACGGGCGGGHGGDAKTFGDIIRSSSSRFEYCSESLI